MPDSLSAESIQRHLYELFPETEIKQAQSLAQVWGEVTHNIIKEMLRISRPELEEVHINLREEVADELVRLTHSIESQVIKDRTSEKQPNQIDKVIEKEECLGEEGQQKIHNTGKILAENIWLKKYHERWKLKTRAALEKEKTPPKKNPLKIKKVDDNHFIPKSFIKNYWSKNGIIRKNIISSEAITFKDISFGQWGFLKNLYSDWLEAYFGLVEGDASIPIKKILKFEILNRPQKNNLIGFIVIQRLRNPYFIESHNALIKPLIEKNLGSEKANDTDYARLLYESIFNNNEIYQKISKPLRENQWVIIRSPNEAIILPDTCNVFTNTNDIPLIVVPISVSDCLAILPVKADKHPFPWYITATQELEKLLTCFLVQHCRSEFLSSIKQEIVALESIEEAEREIIFSIIEIAKKQSPQLRGLISKNFNQP